MQGDVVLGFCDFVVGTEWDVHLADIQTACVLVVWECFEVHVGRDVAVGRKGHVGVDDHQVEVLSDVEGVLGVVFLGL